MIGLNLSETKFELPDAEISPVNVDIKLNLTSYNHFLYNRTKSRELNLGELFNILICISDVFLYSTNTVEASLIILVCF